MQVADVEALPVDIVPIEEITQTVQGAQEAPVVETPAPTPTTRPQIEPEAKNIGDADNVDQEAVEAPKQAPVAVKRTEEAAETPKPEPTPTPEPALKPSPAPAQSTELAAADEPEVPVAPEAPDAAPKLSEVGEQLAKLETSQVPLPGARPSPPKPRTAKTTERKKAEEKPAQVKAGNNAKPAKNPVDDIANLINKQDSTASGAKRSTQTAALGTKKTNGSGSLSQSELDALRSKVQGCAVGNAGRRISQDLIVRTKFELDRSGNIINGTLISGAAGGTSQEQSKYRADVARFVKRCAPYDFLPKDKYETWANVEITFYPAEMFQ